MAIEAFTQSSLQSMVKSHQGEPWLLVLWSIDCRPCYDELSLIQSLHKQYGQSISHAIELVSTDDIERQAEVFEVIQEFSLEKLSLWQFNDSDGRRLRYQIDPRWFGELPKTFAYHENESRQAHSGVLNIDFIKKHLDLQ